MTDMAPIRAADGGIARVLSDPVWLTTAVALVVLGLAMPGQAAESLAFITRSLAWIAPFILLSVVSAAWLKAAEADRLITEAVSRRPRSAIVIAAAFGVLSPFCSCGVVPLIAALLAAGMPLPAVMAFWIASPLMDPEQFLLMLPILGPGFAMAKLAAALTLGLVAGYATLAVVKAGGFADPLRPGVGGGCAAAALRRPVVVRWRFWHERDRRTSFRAEAQRIAFFLLKWLTLAFLLESLMVAWLPGDLVARVLGDQGAFAVPLAAIVGVPTYLNGYAAIPLIGELMSSGMTPGAALAFMLAGGATSIPAAMAVYALVKPAVFRWYIAIALFGALTAGYAYQVWIAGL